MCLNQRRMLSQCDCYQTEYVSEMTTFPLVGKKKKNEEKMKTKYKSKMGTKAKGMFLFIMDDIL